MKKKLTQIINQRTNEPTNQINNIPYQVNKVAKEVTLLPIEGVHDKELVKDTKLTLDVQFLDYEVHIDWQKD